MFQRPHQRSERAIPKAYTFLSRQLDWELLPILTEIRNQPLEWLDSQWKWHIETRFCLLRAGERRAYAGSELTNGHSIDQPSLARLPHTRALLDGAFPEVPTVAWLGSMPQGARIFLHVDNTQHWDEHHRVHVPLVTNSQARLCVDGAFLHLAPGFAWAVNNSVPHGGLNRGPERLHLVVDLPPSERTERWLAEATPVSGCTDPEALAELEKDPLAALRPEHTLDATRLARLRLQ